MTAMAGRSPWTAALERDTTVFPGWRCARAPERRWPSRRPPDDALHARSSPSVPHSCRIHRPNAPAPSVRLSPIGAMSSFNQQRHVEFSGGLHALNQAGANGIEGIESHFQD